ncbi:uncharacterized protein A4U43_C08F6700, partial [Asparagus officinalis]
MSSGGSVERRTNDRGALKWAVGEACRPTNRPQGKHPHRALPVKPGGQHQTILGL